MVVRLRFGGGGGVNRPPFPFFFCGEGGTAPHFCRIIDNLFFYFAVVNSSGLKNTILYKTFIDWVSIKSVGIPVFNFAAGSICHIKLALF